MSQAHVSTPAWVYGHGTCDHEFIIFKNTLLPKLNCDWKGGFKDIDFSLSNFLTQNGLKAGEQLTKYWASQLLETLGISEFRLDSPCQRSASPYSPSDKGWVKECKLDVDLPDLSSLDFITCRLPEMCTGVDCCMDISWIYLSKPMHTLDACHYNLSIGIEKFGTNISLLNYQWGVMKSFYLYGVIRLDYIIDDLVEERLYKLNLNMSVCIEESNCLFNVQVFVGTLLPKPLCNLQSGFSIQNFSLSDWLTNKGLEIGKLLNETMSKDLLSSLGIWSFLDTNQCDVTSDTYSPSKDGWKNDCKKSLSLPAIASNDVKCHVQEHCTGFECCTTVDVLQRKFHTYVDVDTCNHTLIIGIEKFELKYQLHNYNFGKLEEIYMMGVIKISFILTDLTSENMYMISLNLSVCMESVGDCIVDTQVLFNQKLPKILCSDDFSVKDWLSKKGEEAVEKLTEVLAQELFELLQLKRYLLDPQCQRSAAPYNNSQSGWTIDCPSANIKTNLPSVASCYISDKCSAVDCCVDVPFVNRSIKAFIEINPCDLSVTVGIEKMSLKLMMFDYKLGQKHQFLLQGVFRVVFTIEDLKEKELYLVNLNISACFGSEGCESLITIFKNEQIPKKPCDWFKDFKIADFSISDWLAACPSTLNLPILPSNVLCHIEDTCTDVECCITSTRIGRHFNVHVNLDPCYFRINISIEKYQFTISLFDFEFQKTHQIALFGLIQISYNIDDLHSERMFVLNVNLSVCYNKAGPCDIDTVLFKDTQLPKAHCQLDTGFIVKDCPDTVIFPALPLHTSCHIPAFCTGVECCTNVGLLGKTFNTFVHLDSCNYKLHVGIEKLKLDIVLLDYVYGEWKKIYLQGVIHIEFKIDDLQTEEKYLFNLKLKVCFESNGDCRYNFKIFENTRLPKVTCSWNSTFINPGFSLTDWKLSKGIPGMLQLSPLLSSQLLEQIGIAGYMNKTRCDRNAQPYIPATAECAKEIQPLPNLPSDMKCHLFEHCTGIKCCTDIKLLGRSLSTFLILDPCKHTLRLGIEKLMIKISLFQFKFGETTPFYLFGVFKLDFNILDLQGDNSFMVTAKLSVCLDPTSACDFTATIFDNFKLPKGYCPWKTGFVKPDFSYKVWSDLNEYTGVSVLPSFGVVTGLNILLTRHMKVGAQQCNSKPKVILSNIAKNADITCFLDETCTGINCCLYVDWLRKSFNAYVLINPCKYRMEIGIEKLKFTQTLHGFQWSKLQQVHLNGALRVDFRITDLYDEGQYLMFMSYSFCLESNECQTPLALPNLTSHPLTCRVDSTCTNIECCVDSNTIKRSFNVFVNIDPCGNKMQVGIEKLQLTYYLIDYTWGTTQIVSLFGMVKLRFNIANLVTDGVYLINMEVMVCFESSKPCALTVNVLTDSRLPKPECEWNRGFIKPDFSINSWMDENGLTGRNQLDVDSVSKLLHDLGIAPYMKDTQCNRKDLPYFPHSNGWNTACKLPTTLEPLDNTTSCHLDSTCTGVTCCTDVQLLGRSFNTYIYLDPCNYKMTVQIEKLKVEYSLLSYKWNRDEHIYLDGVIRLNFNVEDLVSERKYSLKFSVSVCLESNTTCQIVVPVAKATRLQKTSCRWDSDFIDTDFSLQTWRSSKGLPSTGPLSGAGHVTQLMEDLGIVYFLLDTPCDRSSVPYSPSTQGFNEDCPLQMSNLPAITGTASCHVTSLCTGIYCCIEDDGITGRSFQTFISIDPCNFKMTVGIEKLTFSVQLFDYEQGKEEKLYLFGVVRVKFSIFDLNSEQKYLISMSISLCYESNQPCYKEITIFDNFKLPKKICTWNKFAIDDFSLEQWLQNEEFPLTSPLNPIAVSRLMSDLDMAAYMNTLSCKQSDGHYGNIGYDGWNNECPVTFDKPDLNETTAVCHTSSTCTGINCCVYVPLLDRTFDVFLDVDSCYGKLSVGVEKIYQLSDLIGENKIMMDMNVSVCLETNSTCNMSVKILDGTKLPKQSCSWTKGFAVKDFSLDQWLRVRTCPNVIENLGNITNYPMSCTLEESCTSVECCIESNFIGKTFSINVKLDACNYMLYFGIEKLQFQIPLSDLKWGTDQELWLMGVVRLQYNIYDLASENTYLINMAVTMCWESYKSCDFTTSILKNVRLPKPECNWKTQHVPSTYLNEQQCNPYQQINDTNGWDIDLDYCKSRMEIGIDKFKHTEMLLNYKWGQLNHFYVRGVFRIDYIIEDLEGLKKYKMSVNISVCLSANEPCALDQIVLEDAELTKPVCPWATGYNIPDFSLATWQTKRGLQPGVTLELHYISQLLEELDILPYLMRNSCSIQTYGWKNDCPGELIPNVLDGKIFCHISDKCTAVSCCSEAPTIKRNIHSYIDIDVNNYKVTVGIESRQFQVFLLDFETGKDKEVDLGGVFRLKFNVQDLVKEKKYLASASFSYSSWLSSNGYSSSQPLSGWPLSTLLETLGLSRLLLETQCDRNSSQYTQSGTSTGWNIDCPAPSEKYTDLPGTVSCHQSNSCTAVECCVTVETLSRTIQTFVNIDPCTYDMSVGIENMKFYSSLLDYTWGSSLSVWFYGVVRLEFKIENLDVMDYFIIDMKLSNGQCNYKKGFAKTNFSRTDWITEEGLQPGTPLPNYATAKLKEVLEVSPYMKDRSCKKDLPPYGPSYDGWMKACTAPLMLPFLEGKTSCIILSSCTAIDCCVESDDIGDSFNFYVNLDVCSSQLTVGIDKLNRTVMFDNFRWDFSLNGWLTERNVSVPLEKYANLLLMRDLGLLPYIKDKPCNRSEIENNCPLTVNTPSLPSNMSCTLSNKCTDVNCCFDVERLDTSWNAYVDIDPCKFKMTIGIERKSYVIELFDYKWGTWDNFVIYNLETEQIFKNTELPQKPCKWDTGFANENFSLVQWQQEEDLTANQSLTSVQISKLIEVLGIECGNLDLKNLPDDKINCYIPSYCTRVQCCMDVDLIQRSVITTLDLDPCNMTLILQIEKLHTEVALHDFVWVLPLIICMDMVNT
ncbi:LOW QUALITY PROTEIN: hypothetical protein KUTeg_002087 [Tegillarca granosa]|uniref:Uncharacterized protein n=1 Tax=Tegillarca granosa TaxID=220873 RepID=A0ABQ9FW32_TEGGR|nr:LOW QUALITY PROTEIN: hypothetical protein KUTeg_002087 [Tegillarca granosa]